jgi:hypothetical protein
MIIHLQSSFFDRFRSCIVLNTLTVFNGDIGVKSPDPMTIIGQWKATDH